MLQNLPWILGTVVQKQDRWIAANHWFIFLFYSPPKKINTKKESTWPEKNILIVWTQERCTYMKKKSILVSYEVRSSKDNS